METLWQDLKYGARMLLKQPGFTVVAVLTLALGIGANTAIFSVVYGVLLRPLPYADADRIVELDWDWGTTSPGNLDDRQYHFFAEHLRSFEYVAAGTGAGFTLVGGDEPERVIGRHVSADYFKVFGAKPELGRLFEAEDDQPGTGRTVVLGNGLWKRRFGGQPSIVGQAVHLNGEPYTVIGILPESYVALPAVDLWVPLAPVAKTIGSGGNYTGVAKLKPGITLEQAQADCEIASNAYKQTLLEKDRDQRARLVPFRYQDMLAFDVREPLLVLFAAVGCVLLIACANVANLLLARATGRTREMAIRLALGASRARVFRQLVIECVMLSVAGAALGLLLAQWSVDGLLAISPNEIARAGDVRLDTPVFVFAFLLAIVTSLVFGAAPAFSAARTSLNDSLKEGSGHATSGRARGRLRNALVAGEVAVSLVLLVGAALLIRTFGNLVSTDPGFDPHPLLSLRIWTAGSEYKTSQEINAAHNAILESIARIPGVDAAAIVEAGLPLERGGNVGMRVMSSENPEPFSGDYRAVTPDYFRTLGVPLRAGRLFTAADGEGAQPVVIVNERLARLRFKDQNPLGQQLRFQSAVREVVGVVGDVRSYLNRPAPDCAFIPEAQASYGARRIFEGWFPTNILVRAARNPAQLARYVERAAHEAAPLIPIGGPRPMEQVLLRALVLQRFLMTLMSFFAALAMLLAAVGIYGVMSQAVSERTHEIGIRLALGAQAGDVLGLVLRQGLRLTLIGVGVGLLAAVGLTRLMDTMLFGVGATDPLTFSGVAVLLTAVALAACYLPARRATRVDPMVALRYE